MVAVNGSASAAVTNILSEIKATDPRLQVKFIKTLDDLVIGAAGDQIAMAKLSAFFAGLALLLACVGLYGLMSYTVAGRTREIGVRMALGAQRSSVLKLVLREGLLLVAVGLAAGIPIALVSGRLLKSMLYGLSGTDPVSLGIVIVVLALVATFAGYIPARRATKVDPMVALRYE
jgi:ABC-type antimicrobial peptide transport system permease subunit